MHNRKLFCCNTHVSYQKISWCKNVKKVMTVTFGTVSVLIARKNTGACYISALSCHTVSCRVQQCWKQDQKYKTKTKTEAGLRPVLS